MVGWATGLGRSSQSDVIVKDGEHVIAMVKSTAGDVTVGSVVRVGWSWFPPTKK